jgi:uncharacterized membrane protein
MDLTRKVQKAVIAIAFIGCFFAVIYALNKPLPGQAPTAASKFMFARAKVVKMLEDNASPDTWTEGLKLGSQEASFSILSGPLKGKTLNAVNYLSAYSNIDLSVGTGVIVRLDYDEQGNPYIASVANYDRTGALIALVLAFMAALAIIGGRKGISALAGLAFTVISIWLFLIPLLRRGFPPIGGALLLAAVTTLVSLLLLNGYSRKTFCAAAGCVGGVAISGLAAWLVGVATPISGFNMPEAEELVIRSLDSGMKIKGLLVSGILIASLGAVMDVAMTLSSAVFELHERNPRLDRAELFKSGINIGRDAMGTMANTLILAFAGTSLNMLILFRMFDYPYIQLFNSDLMTIEVISGFAGSLGIVLTVPLVAALSSFYCKSSKEDVAHKARRRRR